MSAACEIITVLVASGMNMAEAAALVARAAVEMTSGVARKSAGAARQQRYRDRHKTVTDRNENVTERNRDGPSQSVTNRNETVTTLRNDETRISYFLSKDENQSEKKEVSKKDRARNSVTRNAPLRDDWTPSVRAYELAEQFGQNVQIVEGIFRDYLKSSGKLYADYDAAFHNFIRNQKTFNRGGLNGVRQSENRGSIVNAADRAIANLEREIAGNNQGGQGIVLSLPPKRL